MAAGFPLNNGSDLTRLWYTPHPRGIATTIQANAITTGDVAEFSERCMVPPNLVTISHNE